MTMIDRLPPVPGFAPIEPAPIPLKPQGTNSFGETLKQFISDVNTMQVTAQDKEMKFATGEIKDVHEVMAAAEEAGLSLQLLLELRNKALEGYKELMRIQV
jgi:flagellar hook-basal body complex protein FliE